MRVNRWFTFLHALVLCLANLAVVFGLAALAYWDPAYLAVSCGFAGLVFFLANNENRWRFPAWVSVCSVVLIAILGIWLAKLDSDADRDAHIATQGLVPLIYLFLIAQALLLVKLTAPRTPADFEIEQGIGFGFILFACGVSRNPWYCGLLLSYIGLSVVALLLHHFRGRPDAATVCRVHVTVRPLQSPSMHGMGLLRLRGLVFWGVVVLPLVLLMFFCIPRPELLWGSEMESFDDAMDLNRTGWVHQGSGTAFTVAVRDGPGTQQPWNGTQGQRWRVRVFTMYLGGRWYSPSSSHLIWTPETGRRLTAGRNERQFDFTVTPKLAGGLVLADPVSVNPAKRIQCRNAYDGTFPALDPAVGTLGQVLPGFRSNQYNYTQIAAADGDPDRMRALSPDDPGGLDEDFNVPNGIRVFTSTLLHDLAAKELYGLTERDLEGEGDPQRDTTPRPSVHGERIALALSQYLSTSREFAYSLERPRINKAIDPTEDFLVKVRAGHCERFAGGLALMLRSQGIPARVVVGFRGGQTGVNGQFDVPQKSAHAWVEALVPPKETAVIGAAVGGPGTVAWVDGDAPPEWLALDPTSYFVPPPPPAATGGWLSTLLNAIGNWISGLGKGWNFNPINFNANMQAEFFAWAAANAPYLVAVATGLLVLFYVARSTLTWFGLTPGATGVSEPFYRRLLEILAWHRGLEPQPAQTPREFGAAARHVLEAEPKSRGVAELPAWIIEMYYRVRFGARPLGGDEQQTVETRLDELRAELKVR